MGGTHDEIRRTYYEQADQLDRALMIVLVRVVILVKLTSPIINHIRRTS